MLIQLLVNHYNESEETVRRFLDSLAFQEVDWNDVEILICSDGTSLPEGLLESYDIPIRYESLPHSGVCHTRNVLLDKSTADYVMFCDIDDCLHSTLGLYRIIKAINDIGSDIIASPYEVEDNGTYRTERRDVIHVFGKAFRRGYLTDNAIRFPDEMPISGDTYFLWLAFNLSPSIVWIKDSFYVWKQNWSSVTRGEDWHRAKTYPLMLHGYELLYQELGRRQRDDLQAMLIGAVFAMMYDNAHDDEYADAPDEISDAMASARWAFASEHIDQYRSLDYKIKKGSLAVKSQTYDVSELDEWVEVI